MNKGILDALNQLTRERRVDKALLYETLQVGLASAVKKKYGDNAEVEVEVDEATGVLSPYLLKTVVEDENEIEDPVCHITLEEAQLDDPELKVGDIVRELLPFSKFGRNAIALAKQVLVQRVREVERGKVFDEFRDRIGEVITANVQQQDRTGVLVTLGKAEAFLPRKESIRRERWLQGQPIKAIVVEVLDVAKGPQIILSRTHPNYIEKLFESEVPEIYDGVVEIKAVARDAGGRSKIAVYSTDDRVDAVGACVGMKGSRVQGVVKELSGERVDIVPWSEDSQQFVTKALSPARVQRIYLERDKKGMTVVVEDDQLSLAIGREGQNVRLAVRLTGWKIDLVGSTEMGQRERLDKEMRLALDDIEGADPEVVKLLNSAGLHTLKDLNQSEDGDLLEIEGLTEEHLADLRELSVNRSREIEDAFVETLESESQLFDEDLFDRVPEGQEDESAPTITFTDETDLASAEIDEEKDQAEPGSAEDAPESESDAAEGESETVPVEGAASDGGDSTEPEVASSGEPEAVEAPVVVETTSEPEPDSQVEDPSTSSSEEPTEEHS